MARLWVLFHLVIVAVIADDETSNRLIGSIHRRRLATDKPRPCDDYKIEAQTNIKECTSTCHGFGSISSSSICYYRTYQKDNQWYRVLRKSNLDAHLSTHDREYDCGNQDAQNQYNPVTLRHMCGEAHLSKIEEKRDDYCTNNDYKCVCNKKKCLWQCALKYGEAVDRPVIYKDEMKVKGHLREEDHPKLGSWETTRIYEWKTSQCEAGTVKRITGEDINLPLLKKVYAKLKGKKEDKAMNEMYDVYQQKDQIDYYYQNEDQLKDELEYLQGYVAGSRAAKRMEIKY